jgi:thymidine kinase
MFCGKTEELIRRLRRAVIAKQQVQVFKPEIDKRYDQVKVISHGGAAFDAVPIRSSADILELVRPETTVVGIDEAQFLDSRVVDVAKGLADNGIRVIVSGLDLDFRGEPFGSMPILLALAEHVDKLEAICMVCGEPATRTQRLVNGKPANYNDMVVVVGAAELYEARCRKHHEVPH